MAKTIKERLTAGLLASGWTHQTNERSHYMAYTHPEWAGRLFVGTSGALRSGYCASKSRSISEPPTGLYKRILAAGDAVLGVRPARAVKTPVESAQAMLAGMPESERLALLRSMA